jgi:hypothetical protein
MLSIKFSRWNGLYLGIIAVLLIGAGFYFFKTAVPKSIPTAFILQVPFTTQAPTDNWSRNEDCEETSIAMAMAFLNGITQDRLPEAEAQSAINNLKKWEQINLGYNADTGAGATTKMAEGAFNLKVRQIQDYTEADLKAEIVQGHPILLPINARLLGSPQYVNDGPTYHMIVIRGFRGDTFIVNDPGTNSGDGNEYTFSVLQNASADWINSTKTMDPSRKIAIVVWK